MKHHIQQHVTPPDTGSSVISSEDDEEDDDSDKINVEKLKSIRKTAQKCQKQKENQIQIQQQLGLQKPPIQANNKETENAAILIQKLWRGYSTRKKTQSMAEILQKKRTQDYIVKLSKDMEMTKQALENERKIQQLQMQAINALWKKVSTMQPTEGNVSGQVSSTDPMTGSGDSTNVVQDLTKTCTILTNQVSFILFDLD